MPLPRTTAAVPELIMARVTVVMDPTSFWAQVGKGRRSAPTYVCVRMYSQYVWSRNLHLLNTSLGCANLFRLSVGCDCKHLTALLQSSLSQQGLCAAATLSFTAGALRCCNPLFHGRGLSEPSSAT